MINIIEELAHIAHQIRLCEEIYNLPPHCKNSEMTAVAVMEKMQRKEGIAIRLYNLMERYALYRDVNSL